MALTQPELGHLVAAVSAARSAREHGNHPFGSVVVTAAGRSVTGENTVLTGNDPTGHAETNVVRIAAQAFTAGELASTTLYTSTEPCAMCAGAIFWSGIPRIVYALGGDELIALMPSDSTEFTLALPSREVFSRGGHPTEVIGPVEIADARAVHEGFWG